MVDNNYNQNIDKDQYGRRKENNNFDDEYVVEDVDAIQEPYPSDDIVEAEDSIEDVDNDDEKKEEENDIHEYEDNDHPHEYRSPTAVIDDYRGASNKDNTNPFERQNPLQSTYPASGRDK